MRALLRSAPLLLLLTSCRGPLVVSCSDDTFCLRSGAHGHCASSPLSNQKFCSFSDPACAPSGLRWDPTAGEGLAAQCVALAPADASGIDSARLPLWGPATSVASGALQALCGASASQLFAVGPGIFRSTNGGETWHDISPTLGSDGGVPISLHGIWCTGSQTVVVVGDSGAILRSDNGGKTWLVQKSGTQNDLNAIWSPGGATYWIVGDGDTVLNTVDGGSSWKPHPTGMSTHLHSVWGTTAIDLRAVGSGGLIVHTSNGMTWILEESGTKGQLLALWGSRPNRIWAGGAGLVLRFDGQAWTPTTLPVGVKGQTLFSLWGSSETELFAGGGYLQGDLFLGEILRSTDGLAWSSQKIPTAGIVTAIWGTGPGNVYATTTSGTVLHEE